MNMFFFKLSAPDQVPPHLDSGTTSKTLLSSISHSVSAGTFRDILSLCIQLLSSIVTCSVFFKGFRILVWNLCLFAIVYIHLDTAFIVIMAVLTVDNDDDDAL